MGWGLSKRLAAVGGVVLVMGLLVTLLGPGGMYFAFAFVGLFGGFELSAYTVWRLEAKQGEELLALESHPGFNQKK